MKTTKEERAHWRKFIWGKDGRANMLAGGDTFERLLDDADELKRLREGIWVRIVSYHETKPDTVEYFDGDYWQTPTIEIFDHDPGEYAHPRRTPPGQCRVKLPIEAKGETP